MNCFIKSPLKFSLIARTMMTISNSTKEHYHIYIINCMKVKINNGYMIIFKFLEQNTFYTFNFDISKIKIL